MSDKLSRRDLLVGAGVGAVALGIGAWARLRRTAEPALPAVDGLWRARFPAPSGGMLDLAQWQGHRVVLNFWAPWCPPCVREMPQFDRFQREFMGKGWQVLGIAIDSEAAVKEFVQKTPVHYPLGLGGLEATDLMAALGNVAGALPYTVLFDAQGRTRKTHLGETRFEELRRWAAEIEN
jgi:thiol-disulfide isomerase/thioredoxin